MTEATMSSPDNLPEVSKGCWCKESKQFMAFDEAWKHGKETFDQSKDGKGHVINFFDTKSPPSVEMARMEGVPLEKFLAWQTERQKGKV
jgi:hypothetical protein